MSGNLIYQKAYLPTGPLAVKPLEIVIEHDVCHQSLSVTPPDHGKVLHRNAGSVEASRFLRFPNYPQWELVSARDITDNTDRD